MSRTDESVEIKGDLWLPRAVGREENVEEWTWVSIEGDKNVLELIVRMVTRACEYTETHSLVHIQNEL